MPVRIYDIAKKFGIESKQVIAKAKELGIAAKVPSSSLDKISAEFLEATISAELAAAMGRGLRVFSLGNFKAFADSQSIPIRPLTLIFGANSSGKSSIIHGLLLAHHALETGQIDTSRTVLGGEALDLGGFRQFVHRRDASQTVELVLELATDILGANAGRLLSQTETAWVTLSFGMPQDDKGQPVPGQGPRLVSYEVATEAGSVLRLSRRPDETMQLDRMDEEAIQPLISAMLLHNSTTQAVDEQADRSLVMEAVRRLIPTLRFTCGKLLPERLVGEEMAGARAPQLTPVGRGNRAEELANIAERYLPWNIAQSIRDINAALRGQLERLTYLGPLRSFPARHLAFLDETDPNWRAGGGYAWNTLRDDKGIRDQVNRWLSADFMGTKYELVRLPLISSLDLRKHLPEKVEAALREFLERLLTRTGDALVSEGMEEDDSTSRFLERLALDIAHRQPGEEFPDLQDLVASHSDAGRTVNSWTDLFASEVSGAQSDLVFIEKKSETQVSHRDVGIGVSQVLPVLVHAYADKNRLVAIEQPEIHLHPALQAELADVFIESALGERRNTFFIETHSEHVILRILRRVRETTEKTPEKMRAEGLIPVRPEDVTVVFVEPTANGSVIRHLPVTPDGDFGAPWPGGFFAERFQDLP